MPEVASHADDRSPLHIANWWPTPPNSLSNRILVRERALRERFVDDADAHAVVIGVGEPAPLHDRDANRGQKVGRDELVHRFELLTGTRHWPPLGHETGLHIPAAERNPLSRSDSGNAGDSAQPVQQLREERDAADAFGVLRRRKGDAHREHALLLEAEFRAL